jgi:hypothetical protein
LSVEHLQISANGVDLHLAWHMGIHYPDRIRGIAPLCVPYDMELSGGAEVLPSQLFAALGSPLGLAVCARL